MTRSGDSSQRALDAIANAARAHVLDGLKSGIRRVKQACGQFERLDPTMDAPARDAVVAHVIDELTVHAALEQDLLYPALREAMDEEGRRTLDAAQANHAGLHLLINPLRRPRPDDDSHARRFHALCQQALHHMAWEEACLFPMLEDVVLDWARLEGEIDQRREELVVSEMPVTEV